MPHRCHRVLCWHDETQDGNHACWPHSWICAHVLPAIQQQLLSAGSLYVQQRMNTIKDMGKPNTVRMRPTGVVKVAQMEV